MEAVVISIASATTASILAFLFQVIFNRFSANSRKTKFETEIQKLALQALMRIELRRYGKIYLAQGWVDDADKYDYDNLYTRYHNLGKNGVMDDMYAKVMALPTQKPKE